ncbi:MAG: hypothetical protein ACXAEU_22285 [Candidatus Hodarchaeales archaeon]
MKTFDRDSFSEQPPEKYCSVILPVKTSLGELLTDVKRAPTPYREKVAD